MRSTSAPVTGAENADAYVRNPRNSPEANVLPPSARIRNGAVGKSWNAERKTMKEKPHITKKRSVNRRSGNDVDFIATARLQFGDGSGPLEFQAVEAVAQDAARSPHRRGRIVLGRRAFGRAADGSHH